MTARSAMLPAFVSAPEANRVYQVDALTLLKAMPSGSVDLIVTSPPYNMGTQLNGASPCSRSNKNWGNSQLLADGYDGIGDSISHEEYISQQRAFLTESMRTLKDTGAIFYNHKWRIQGGLLDMRSEIVVDFPVRQIIIWWRGSGNNHGSTFFAPEYEVIYLIAKPKFNLVPRRIHFGDVWKIRPEANNDHPAPFPVTLAERCILATNARLIVDPYGGSGTTAYAAQKNGRNYITGDVSFKYCESIRKRLDAHFTLPMFTESEAIPC